MAIVDSGVNAKLPDLRSVVLRGSNTAGHDSDGRVDLDRKKGGHGTSMASLVAGQGRAGGAFGLAPKAKILPISDRDPGSSYDQEEATEKGIRYAVKHGAKVINLSFGSPSYKNTQCVEQDVIDYAIKRDVVVIASAGNEGRKGNRPQQPAGCPGVVAAGGLARDLEPWAETQRQPYVVVSAPADRMTLMLRSGRVGLGLGGTSAAAALTSATVALIRSKYPNMSAREVVQRLTATAKDVGDPGWDNRSGYGMIRPYEALTAKIPPNAPNPVYEKWDKHQAQNAPPSTPNTKGPRPLLPGEDVADDSRRSTPLKRSAAIGTVSVIVSVLIAAALVIRKRGLRSPGKK